ncbi:unnamed protein product [Porites lobata]|uniref:Uncharacterized protein n=1 Tax=Porites lobata TaxID=104759 RepID=A0ABN8P848_9CNID|nr:unnamed protein product [Porites lobata]
MANWTKSLPFSFLQINILDYDLLLIPVHLPHHWALGGCCCGCHTKNNLISYWDGKQIISPAFFKNIR